MCGSQLTVHVGPREVRKTVTVVFSDLKDSTAIGERLDTESVREALTFYFAEMQAVLRRHGGTVEKYIGDAIMAVFGLPTVHEDDAIRAVRAALEMQTRLRSINDEMERNWGVRLQNRTGVHTGEVVAGDASSAQRLVSGDTVNTAARLEQAAPTDGVLIGATTYELVKHAAVVEPMEPLDLKGKADRVAAFRLLAIRLEPDVSPRLAMPLVGRVEELARLRRAHAEATRTEAGHLVTVLGSAGVGKSRLISEFLASLDPPGTILRGRCLSYGDGITFWPLIEAIRGAAGIEEDQDRTEALPRLSALCGGRTRVVDRLASIIGLSDATFALEETFWAVRALLQGLGDTAPAVVIFDDIHWAEPTLLDLIEELGAAGDVPALVIGSARAELVDEHPHWAEKVPRAIRIDLRPLSADDSHAIIAALLGGSAAPEELVDRISRAAEGNPLFVEQMVSMLVDGEVLRQGRDGAWALSHGVDSIAMPPTVAAVIEARLDRLPEDDRSVLQEGSVIGVVFYPSAVQAMSPPELSTVVGRSLERLTRRQFVRPEPTTFMDEPSVRFEHALIQDGAYRSLLKRERADLHERFARWLEARSSSGPLGTEEIIGYHLEQAVRNLGELGPADEHARELARWGSAQLAVAGRRASARGDSPAAANLLERAAGLLDPGERDAVELRLHLAEVLAALGEFDRSAGVAGDAMATARDLHDSRLVTNAELVMLYLRYTLDPQGMSDEVIRTTQDAIASLEAAGDHGGLVRAWRLLGWVHGTACHYGAAEAAVEEAVRHARSAGDRRAETRNLMSIALSALYGPRPVAEAIVVAHRTAEEVADDRRAEGVVLCALAHLQALAGSFDEARTSYRAARSVLEELGGTVMAATVGLDSGSVELLAGDPEAAEGELRRDYETLESIGERYTLSTVAGMLGEALLAQGRGDEALEFTAVAEQYAADDDVESQSLWRRVRARALSNGGHANEALLLAEQAYALVRDTDAPVLRAECLVDLATVLAKQQQVDAARQTLLQAMALLEAKGDIVDAARAQAQFDSLAVGTHPG